jgi:type IV secretory pathway VirB10-like protein
MAENATPNVPNQIQDKAPKPKGLMPKNVQALVMGGIALLMILIMAVTGHKRPKMPTATASPQPVAAPVDQTRIAGFGKDIQQEQEQSTPGVEAALLAQQRRLAAERRFGGDPASLYGNPVTGAPPNGVYPPGAYAATSQPQTTQPQDPIREAEEKRKYESLFADNVALSYRKHVAGMRSEHGLENDNPALAAEAFGASSTSPHSLQDQQQLLDQEAAQLQQEEQMLESAKAAGVIPRAALPQPLPLSGTAEKTDSTHRPSQATDARNPYVAAPGEFNRADGKTYVLFEGTIIQAVLVNRLEGSFAGPVACLVTNDVYSHDRQHLLIPAGSKVFGHAKRVDTFGQSRLAVSFDRLLMPDGYSVNLDQFAGLGQEGATALKDKVNNHYAKMFGASLALGVLGGASEFGTGGALTANGGDLIRQGFGISMATSGEQIMNRFLNQMPTVTIREGTRVKIYLSNDLLLPDYTEHEMQQNL